MPTFDTAAAVAALAAYRETCDDWQEVCHREEHGDIDATEQIAASEAYYDGLADDAHALADVLGKLLDQLGATEPARPLLTIPADAVEGDEVTCTEQMDDGTLCGSIVECQEKVWDYRPLHYGENKDGTKRIDIGDGQMGDGEFVGFMCEGGHAFDTDWDRTEYR